MSTLPWTRRKRSTKSECCLVCLLSARDPAVLPGEEAELHILALLPALPYEQLTPQQLAVGLNGVPGACKVSHVEEHSLTHDSARSHQPSHGHWDLNWITHSFPTNLDRSRGRVCDSLHRWQ